MNEAQTAVSRPSRSIATPPSAEDGWQRVNPALATFLLLDDLNVTLAEVLEELRVRPTGEMVPLSDTQSGVPASVEWIEPPLFGFTLTNDGPADIEYNVGGRQTWCTLKANETIQTDMRQPIIDRIAFQCAPGQTASWRLTGIR